MKTFTLKELQESDNIVDLFEDGDESDLYDIGQQVVKGFKIDEESRSDWKDSIDEALKMDRQLKENKNFPWPGAADIKFPLITEAAIDFAARTSPALIQNDQVVRCEVIGYDPNGAKYMQAERIQRYMSYQLVQDSTDWLDNMDQLLQMLPVMGTVFKKVYYSPLDKGFCIELCSPYRVVVNYSSRSLDSARRITHVIQMYANDIVERQLKGIYCDDVDVEQLTPTKGDETSKDPLEQGADVSDEDPAYTILEQHTWLDLDGDGYKEPYIVTVEKESAQVLRIVNRFKNIEKNSKDQVTCIEPQKYFVDYHCIRSSDGGFYSRGFGSLLLPTNKAINSTFNQLIDAGTLNNVQGGFIGRGLRVKNGTIDLAMGEWKVLDCANGTDIKANIFPLPTKEPSSTLYNLLELLIKTGKDLSQSIPVTQGQSQVQNVSNGAINNQLEQGTQVHNDIRKRLYRSLTKEYNMLYDINCDYPNPKHYRMVLNDPNADYKADFERSNVGIYPVGDPMLSSTSQRMLKAQMLQGLATADKRGVDMYIVKTMQLEPNEVKQILPPINPKAPPPPDIQLTMSETKLNETKAQQIQLQTTMQMQEQRMSPQKLALEAKQTEANYNESQARVWKMQKDAAHGDAKLAIAATKIKHEEQLKSVNLIHKQNLDKEKLITGAMTEANKAHKTNLEAKANVLDNATKIDIANINKQAKLQQKSKEDMDSESL